MSKSEPRQMYVMIQKSEDGAKVEKIVDVPSKLKAKGIREFGKDEIIGLLNDSEAKIVGSPITDDDEWIQTLDYAARLVGNSDGTDFVEWFMRFSLLTWPLTNGLRETISELTKERSENKRAARSFLFSTVDYLQSISGEHRQKLYDDYYTEQIISSDYELLKRAHGSMEGDDGHEVNQI